MITFKLFFSERVKVDEAQGDGKIAITDLTLHIFSCVVPLYLLTEEEKTKSFKGDIAGFSQVVFTYFIQVLLVHVVFRNNVKSLLEQFID